MKKIGLFGCGRLGSRVLKEVDRAKCNIVAVADNYQAGRDCCGMIIKNAAEICDMYRNGDVDGFVISVINDEQRTEVALGLLEAGVKKEDICFVPEWIVDLPCEVAIDIADELIPLNNFKPTLHYLDIPVVDYCNLNCKCCWMACNLVEKGQATSIDKYKKDLGRLSEIFYNVESIHFMGGEPFLHEKITEYVEFASKTFPKADLWITTNGLLLQSLPDKVFDVLREHNVAIGISFYPLMEKKMYDIIKFLVSKNIRFYITPEKKNFLKIFSHEEQDAIETRKVCPNTKCHYLQEGRMYGCGVPITMRRLQKLDKLPWAEEENGCDIYGEEDGWDIRRQLDNAFSTCTHCTANMQPIEWKNVGKDVSISDWFVD